MKVFYRCFWGKNGLECATCRGRTDLKDAREGGQVKVTPPNRCRGLREGAAEREELRRSIQEAVMELPERERDVVILRMLEGRSTRETAEALRCAEGTVKAALHHALKKLQTSMEVWVR